MPARLKSKASRRIDLYEIVDILTLKYNILGWFCFLIRGLYERYCII